MSKNQNYRIAPYTETSQAMYEADDFRLEKLESVGGVFTRDARVIGLVNGEEIGVFDAENGIRYLVFADHSARALPAE